MTNYNWLFSKKLDLFILFLPVWIVWGLVFLLPTEVINREVSLWVWVIFVIGIDVSHVWSTIFRTYLDKEEFQLNKLVLILAPIIGFCLFFGIATISYTLFWSILAYLAVFHFIKQQFGFMRLYQAKSAKRTQHKWINDKFVIYMSMIYPVFYWHSNSNRAFEWFVQGDFINISQYLVQINWGTELISILNIVGIAIYWIIIIYWLIGEVKYSKTSGSNFPIGKVLWILTTAINWFLGIVYFNSDFVFTATNVVAHGVPYLALIFFYVEKKKVIKKPEYRIKVGKVIFNVSAMLALVLILAFGEEYLWDMFLYRDNESFFQNLLNYPFEELASPYWQAFALAILSLPQVTHYILDGFIWKSNDHNPYLKKILLQ